MNDLFNESTHGAEFSKCGKYRYKLFRIWNRELPLVMAIGLNPSTANANKNDQTINYLILMLTKLGYGGFYMMNCWPCRNRLTILISMRRRYLSQEQ